MCFIEVHPKREKKKKIVCKDVRVFCLYFYRFVKRSGEKKSSLISVVKITGSKAYISSPSGFVWRLGINMERTCSLGALQGSILKGKE